MTTPRRRAYEARVLGLRDEALMRHHLGHVSVAVEKYREACDLIRAETAGPAGWAGTADAPGTAGRVGTVGPPGPADVQRLASMLCTLGEWELSRAGFAAAVDALTEAESLYRDLGDREQRVADVVIRRARVHAAAGRHLSAVVDAQRAVLACLARVDGPPRSAARLDAARVVAFAAQVQCATGGDPDLVVNAADWALREFVGGQRVGDTLEVRGGDLVAFRVAATLAYRVHTAFGRTGPATTAAATAATSAARAEEAGPGPVRTWPTLAALLAERGLDRHRAALTARPALLVPALRADGRVRGTVADLLAGLRDGSEPEADALLATEAHALFAAASEGGDIDMRYQFGRCGRVWAELLLSVGRQARADGIPGVGPQARAGETVADVAHWLVAVLGQLAPHTDVDAAARAVTIDARRWLREVGHPAGAVADLQAVVC